MRLKHIALALVVLGALATWFALRPSRPAGAAEDPRLVEQEVKAFGTRVFVRAYLDEGMPRGQGRKAVAAAALEITAAEQRTSAAGPDELGQFNRALATGASVPVPEALADLFSTAAELNQKSRGLFDARAGALLRLWGFGAGSAPRSTAPAPEEIAAVLDALRVAPAYQPGQPYGPAPGITWDFGALALGHAQERAMAQFKSAGIGNALVETGRQARAAGRRGAREWRVGVHDPRDPRAPQTPLVTLATLGEEAVATRSEGERAFGHNDRRYHAVLHPRTGYPADTARSVTVVAGDAALAGAAATALFLAGDRWRDLSILLNVSQVLILDAEGRLTVTRALARRLVFSPEVRVRVVD